MFYFVKTPWWLKKFYNDCVWNIPAKDKTIYLTFDDGPHPQATLFVLDVLKKYHAKATFFCVGKNVQEHFEIYKQMINEGHKPANHTYNHLSGWKTKDATYLDDIKNAARIIDSNLFRPPYGRITKFQLKALQEKGFRLQTIMWDVLSGDFDTSLSGEDCYLNVIKNVKPGSIIVFHDSQKALPRLQYALPKIMDYFINENYVFETIPEAL